MNIKTLINKLAVICMTILITGVAHASVILESATLGATGQTGGVSLGGQYVGARFQVTQATTVECVGGHMFGQNGDFFGAIAMLSSGNDLPDGPADGPDFIYINTFQPPFPSADLVVSANFVLAPGYYALVFGSQEFGATGSGGMPTNNTDTPAASYMFWNGANWNNGVSNARFTVANGADCNGAIQSTEIRNTTSFGPQLPIPTLSQWGIVLLILSIAGMVFVRRKQLS